MSREIRSYEDSSSLIWSDHRSCNGRTSWETTSGHPSCRGRTSWRVRDLPSCRDNLSWRAKEVLLLKDLTLWGKRLNAYVYI